MNTTGINKLVNYFTDGIRSGTAETVGAEIETQFVDNNNEAISVKTSQQILMLLSERGWKVVDRKGNLITALVDTNDNKIFYELGRHNIEVATAIATPESVLDITEGCLNQVYEAGNEVMAYPYFSPILAGEEDLLVIPDERDAVWLELDGRAALKPLARTSAVQFTVSLTASDAVNILNKFGANINLFLKDYPQEVIWRRYIADSLAGYRPDRYGGPLVFDSLTDYCQALAKNDVVQGTHLTPFSNVPDLDISLYLRSIWWYFRLKRYGNALCIEIRPMPRRSNKKFPDQLKMVLDIIYS